MRLRAELSRWLDAADSRISVTRPVPLLASLTSSPLRPWAYSRVPFALRLAVTGDLTTAVDERRLASDNFDASTHRTEPLA
jgi:hypothetical protein